MEQRKNNFLWWITPCFTWGSSRGTSRSIAFCVAWKIAKRDTLFRPDGTSLAPAESARLRRLIWHSRSLFAVALLRKLIATARSTDTRQTTIKSSKSTTIICRFELTPSSWWTEGGIENGDTINKSLTVI